MATNTDLPIYSATIWDETYRIRANFAEASCPIEHETDDGRWVSWRGLQVADFCHSSADAMTEYLREMESNSGEDPDDDEIAEAVAGMATTDV